MVEQCNVRELSLLQFSLLRSSGIFKSTSLKGIADSAGTLIFDLNGEERLRRVPLAGPDALGYLDLATDPVASGGLLLGIVCDKKWDESSIFSKARERAKLELPGIDVDSLEVRFVLYSDPKVGVQFIDNLKRAILLLDIDTLLVVPPPGGRDPATPPGYFEQWSYLEELSEKRRKFRAEKYERQLQALGFLLEGVDARTRAVLTSGTEFSDLREIEWATYDGSAIGSAIKIEQNEIKHYYLRAQPNQVWCVPASLEMILAFYGHDEDQNFIARELGLEVEGSIRAFDPTRIADLPGALRALSDCTVLASLRLAPPWDLFKSQIDAGRPLIDIIDGHVRTVAGYVSILVDHVSIMNGLVVFDPWPPGRGQVICWESIDRYEHRGLIIPARGDRSLRV